MKSGKNLADLTNENKAHILRYLIHHEGISRIELSAATGLRPASITKIIQQLIEQELVTETGLSLKFPFLKIQKIFRTSNKTELVSSKN